MSYRKSKLDLLVRVRYQNPLPAPPFPPKLLNIPTHPSRYARPDFTAALESETPLPMVVDAECGMPLDLSIWDNLWDENGDDSALNPDPHNLPPLDPKDAFLLGDSPAVHAPYPNGSSSSTSPLASRNVSWLRKTEYLSRENLNRSSSVQDLRHIDKPVDVSLGAQIRDIDASFPSISAPFDLSKLRHPNKTHVTAVDSYEILPDIDTWPNAYDLFRFSERPGERQTDGYDPRLDCAILRPMQSDGDHFLAYYLPKEDDVAEVFKLRRSANENTEEETTFSFVRDYETVKIEQDVPNEFLLVLEEGDGESEEDEKKPSANGHSSVLRKRKRPKGAYYKGIERKIMLKKRRVNQWENLSYSDKWDAIDLTLAHFDAEDLKYREEALAEVNDPMYMRLDADADGVAEDDISGSTSAPMDGVEESSLTNGTIDTIEPKAVVEG